MNLNEYQFRQIQFFNAYLSAKTDTKFQAFLRKCGV